MSEQVKFLSGLKSQLKARAELGDLTPGALYFCTDEKKIFKATANNAYEAVNEEVYSGDELPAALNAFPGKLYLRKSDMTLHVLNGAGDGFKQLSTPANALTSDDISEKLNKEDGKKLVSKKAVKGAVDSLAIADAQVLADAKKYADTLAGHYSGEVDEENKPIPASGLRKEIEDRIAAEKARAESAEKGLTDDIAIINGTGDGSIKKAVADEKTAREEADTALGNRITAEATARTKADEGLDARIAALEGDGAGSVAAQIKGVQDQVDSIKNVVGHEAIPGGDGQEAQAATGLFAKIDEEKTRAEGKEAEIKGLLDTEVNRAKAAEQANAKAIADEQTRAETAEQANANAIKKETSDRETAISDLQGKIDTINSNIGETGALGAQVKENKEAIAAINNEDTGILAKAKKYTDDAVGVAPSEDNEGSGLLKDIADAEKRALADAKTYADGKITALVNGAPEAMDTLKELADAIDAHQDVYEAYVNTVSGELAKKVDKVEGSRLVAETEVTKWNAKAETSDVEQALTNANSYTDTEVKEVSDKVGDLNTLETTVRTSAVSAINELKGDIDDINDALGLGGATGGTSIKDRLDSLEGVVGDAGKGLVKGVADNAAAIAIINGGETQEGSIAKALKDANTYTDTAKAAAIEAAETKAGELDAALQTKIEGDNGKLMKAIKAEEDRAIGVENGLNTRLEAVEASIGDGGDLELRVDAVEAAIGDENSGLTKKVNDNAAKIAENTTNITNNADAIATINHETTGILAQAKADATTKADAAKDAAIEEAKTLDTTLKDNLEDYADGIGASALANAKKYVDKAIGKPSASDGTTADGLHKVIEDGDTAAKNYADNAVTSALTWGSF